MQRVTIVEAGGEHTYNRRIPRFYGTSAKHAAASPDLPLSMLLAFPVQVGLQEKLEPRVVVDTWSRVT